MAMDRRPRGRQLYRRASGTNAVSWLLAGTVAVLAVGACKRAPPTHAQLARLAPIVLARQHRTLVLHGEIDERLAKQVSQQLTRFRITDAQAPVTLLIDASGAAGPPARAIRTAMDASNLPIYTHCLGAADGAAAFLLAHGQRGHRTASVTAQLSLQPLTFPKPQPAPDPSRPPRERRPQFIDDASHVVNWPKNRGPGRARAPAEDEPRERPVGVDTDVPTPVAAEEPEAPDETQPLRLVMNEELAADTGQDATRIAEDVAASRHFAAADALSYGLIDRIEE